MGLFLQYYWRFTTLPKIHPFMPTFTAESTMQAGSSEGVASCSGHLRTQLGGFEPATFGLTNRPALPPEPHAAPAA